jgi:hypothetical protein
MLLPVALGSSACPNGNSIKPKQNLRTREEMRCRLLGTKHKSQDVRWFTEGFDTGDLIGAKALLKALAA